MMTNTTNIIFKLQVVAILVLTAGWGWSAGNFTPAGAPFLNPLLHCIPIVLLLVLGLQFFRAPADLQRAGSHTRGAIVGISIFAALTIIGCIVMIALGASNPDPNAVGVKTLEDWFPTAINLAGSFLWLATLIPALRGHTEAQTAGNV